MKKIPTMFERDWAGDRSRVVDKIHRDCQWVADGEGVATRKIDGTSCLVRGDKLYKRREVKPGDSLPLGFELSTFDEETGKNIGWIPVGDGPDDKWHREAFHHGPEGLLEFADGTYELIGPKVQGNPEKVMEHVLVRHATLEQYPDCPRTFDALKAWLSGRDIEGIVFHHPDGRMAKIKLKDFGLKR